MWELQMGRNGSHPTRAEPGEKKTTVKMRMITEAFFTPGSAFVGWHPFLPIASPVTAKTH